MLDRVVLRLMLLALAGILTAAMAIQFAGREIPCPLCLLNAQQCSVVALV